VSTILPFDQTEFQQFHTSPIGRKYNVWGPFEYLGYDIAYIPPGRDVDYAKVNPQWVMERAIYKCAYQIRE
jgi:hypothetical protein